MKKETKVIIYITVLILLAQGIKYVICKHYFKDNFKNSAEQHVLVKKWK